MESSQCRLPNIDQLEKALAKNQDGGENRSTTNQSLVEVLNNCLNPLQYYYAHCSNTLI